MIDLGRFIGEEPPTFANIMMVGAIVMSLACISAFGIGFLIVRGPYWTLPALVVVWVIWAWWRLWRMGYVTIFKPKSGK
jgi:hypothetical protein